MSFLRIAHPGQPTEIVELGPSRARSGIRAYYGSPAIPAGRSMIQARQEREKELAERKARKEKKG